MSKTSCFEWLQSALAVLVFGANGDGWLGGCCAALAVLFATRSSGGDYFGALGQVLLALVRALREPRHCVCLKPAGAVAAFAVLVLCLGSVWPVPSSGLAAVALLSGSVGLVPGAAGLVPGAAGLVSAAVGLLSGSVVLVPGAAELVSAAVGPVTAALGFELAFAMFLQDAMLGLVDL